MAKLICFWVAYVIMVLMENLKGIICKNLIYLRKKHGLTQIELAEKINYSDNAISRWERGEVTPSIETLEILGGFYDVSVKSLLEADFAEENEKAEKTQKINRILTVILSISVVWFVTIIIYIYVNMFLHENLWVVFVAAVPASCAVALFFNRRWGYRKLSLWLTSGFAWTSLATVYLWFLDYNPWLIFILGAPLQSALVTWYFYKKSAK